VWFGSATTIYDGTLLCYDDDVVTTATGETATDAWGQRLRTVALPVFSNAEDVAGVAYGTWPSKTGGREIEIVPWTPNEACYARVEVAATINATFLTAGIMSGSQGCFYKDGLLPGRGRLKVCETIANATSLTDTTPQPVSNSFTGTGEVTTATLTLTDTAKFTYAAAGDRVIVLGGVQDAAVAGNVTPGEYIIASRTSADAVVLTSSPCDTTGTNITYYVVRGHPTALCRMDDDSRETGLIEFVSPIDNAAAQSTLLSGTSFVCAGETLTTGDSTATLADHTNIGARKIFWCLGTLTTKDYVVTVTSGAVIDGSDASGITLNLPNTITMDAAGEFGALEWRQAKWYFTAFSSAIVTIV